MVMARPDLKVVGGTDPPGRRQWRASIGRVIVGLGIVLLALSVWQDPWATLVVVFLAALIWNGIVQRAAEAKLPIIGRVIVTHRRWL
jgi:hypothetical protein